MTTISALRGHWSSVTAWALVLVMIAVVYVTTPARQGLGQAPDWSLRHILPVADQFDINRVSDGVEYPVIHLASGQNPKIFALLKHSGHFHAAPPREKPDFIFDVPAGAGKVYFSASGLHSCPTFDYVSRTGELGTGHDWCYVPAQFKVWMQALKAKTPARQFQVKRTPYYTGAHESKPQKTR